MKKLLLVLWTLIASIAWVNVASAQGPVKHCYTTNGLNCVPAVQASASAKVSISSATTTEIVPLVAAKNVFVTSFELVSTAAQTAKWVYGTGTACATGTTDLTGAYGMSTFTVISKGNGLGVILLVPPGNALCITTTTTGQLSGSVSYAQF